MGLFVCGASQPRLGSSRMRSRLRRNPRYCRSRNLPGGESLQGGGAFRVVYRVQRVGNAPIGACGAISLGVIDCVDDVLSERYPSWRTNAGEGQSAGAPLCAQDSPLFGIGARSLRASFLATDLHRASKMGKVSAPSIWGRFG